MPPCSLFLLSLTPGTSIQSFLSELRNTGGKPFFQARVARWIVLPTSNSADPLLAHNTHWDLLIALPGSSSLPAAVQTQISSCWSLVVEIPSQTIQDLYAKKARLLTSTPAKPKPVDRSGASPQQGSSPRRPPALPAQLSAWISARPAAERTHPVCMFNLLTFHPDTRAQYKRYGDAFSAKVGARHGGDVRLVAELVGGQGRAEGWDEIVVGQYPSVDHFVAMIGSRDYREINRTYRLGAVKDTCILCTMEVGDDGELAVGRRDAAML